MSKCRKCHLKETKFGKITWGGMPQVILEACTFGAKINSLFPLKRGWNI